MTRAKPTRTPRTNIVTRSGARRSVINPSTITNSSDIPQTTIRPIQAATSSSSNTSEQTYQAPANSIANTTQQSLQPETENNQQTNSTITNSQYTSLLAALEQIHQRFDIYDSIINNLNI